MSTGKHEKQTMWPTYQYTVDENAINKIRELTAHRSLCLVVGFILRPTMGYLVMESSNGGSLFATLAAHNEKSGDRLSWEERLGWVFDIAGALRHLCQHGFAHGNLTSHNCEMHLDVAAQGPEHLEPPQTQCWTDSLGRPQRHLQHHLRHQIRLTNLGCTQSLLRRSSHDDMICNRAASCLQRFLKPGLLQIFGRPKTLNILERDVAGDPNADTFQTGSSKVADCALRRPSERSHMWQAPELASRNYALSSFYGNVSAQRGDVFALGVIMAEVLTLQPPTSFFEHALQASGPASVLSKRAQQLDGDIGKQDMVMRGCRPQIFTPVPAGLPAPKGYVALLRRCWRQEATHRPHASGAACDVQAVISKYERSQSNPDATGTTKVASSSYLDKPRERRNSLINLSRVRRKPSSLQSSGRKLLSQDDETVVKTGV